MWPLRWDNYRSFIGFQLWNWGKSELRRIKLNVTCRFGQRKGVSHNSNFGEVDNYDYISLHKMPKAANHAAFGSFDVR